MLAINGHLGQSGKTPQDINIPWSDPAHSHMQEHNQGGGLVATRGGEGTMPALLFGPPGLVQFQDMDSVLSPRPAVPSGRGKQY